MIKWAVVFSLAFVALVKGANIKDGLLAVSIRQSLNDCYEDTDKKIKVNFNTDAFKALMSHDPDPDRSTKCMRHCILESHKLFNDDGTANGPEIHEFLKKAYPDNVSDNDKNAIEESIKICTDDVATNYKDKERCELIHDASMCIISSLAEKGIDLRTT